MFTNAWKVARIAGVDVRVDASWSIIALLIVYSLYLRFTALDETLAAGPAVVFAVVAALLFFGSVLLHELAHSLVARSLGIPVKGITLFLFGGVTEARVESKRSGDEFRIAIVGPLTSLALAAVFWAVEQPLSGTARDAAGYLAWVNLALAVFNMIPGFPLDGGRVLRAMVWGTTGSYTRATNTAARLGRFIGHAMIAFGILSLLFGGVGGLWIAAIGWFLAQAATSSLADLQLKRLLAGVDADDVMARDLVTADPATPLPEAIEGLFLRHHHSAFPVVDHDGTLLGLLTLGAVRRTTPEARRGLVVSDVMVPAGDVPVSRPHDPLDRILERLQDQDLHRVLVMDDGRAVGMITPRDISRWMQRLQDLGLDR